ncbi:hypothetical protein A8W25_01230 [Streptomyces sp. ERV7]|uniref:condensation domain-containing protein n=1 Tax=Streptomyces sp. ERV7 TaxID=1322334 RepID=UPI0007F4E09E|nr:condensation domain-containing protein [Streptomyces sp. ERV7]OAR26942.1 hypothetical protein A8W25_01230 [Streptomyces sp. ERV7]
MLRDETPTAQARLDSVRGGPLSHAQRRFLMAEHFSPGAADNTLVQVYILTGPLQPDTLGQALQQVVARHPVLRTVYPWANGQPIQLVLSVRDVMVQLEYVPPPLDRAMSVQEVAEAVTADWWDTLWALDREPPVEARLCRLSEGQHLLCLRFHHIAFDGWSEGVFLRDLELAYRQALAGQTPYSEPASGELQAGAREREQYSHWMAEELPYWETVLAAAPGPVLPTPQTNHEAACQELVETLPPAAVTSLTSVVRRRGGPPTAAVVALAGLALSRAYATPDVCLGTLTSGRYEPVLDSAIGYFVNPLAVPLRSLLSDVSAVVDTAADQVLAAFEHARTPFDELVRLLRPERPRHAWFQAWAILQGPLPSGELADGLAFSSVRVRPPRTTREWTLQVFPQADGGWEFVQQWREDVMDRRTAASVMGHLLDAAEEVCGLR